MSTSASDPGSGRLPGGALAVVIAVAAGIIAGSFLLAGSPVRDGAVEHEGDGRTVAASVGGEVIHRDEIDILGRGPGPDAWVEDELLAQLAVESGLEDPVVSAFVQRRARQLYLRDEILSSALSGVEPPSGDEVLALMRGDSLLYMVERHYFEILVADSSEAESLHTRLQAGQSFQVMSENLSLGQRASLGGDMGFLVGGELTGRGLPASTGLLEGLGPVVGSDLGWHIFLVTETRPLTDTSRVVLSLSEVIAGQRRRAVVDSLLAAARAGRDVEVDMSCWR